MRVLMLGPSKESMGGIATVIKNFHIYFKCDDIDMIYLDTWKEGDLSERLKVTLVSLLKFIKYMIIGKIDIVHVHMAQGGSFYRKSLMIIIGKLFRKNILLHMHASQFDKFYLNSNNMLKSYIKLILKLPTKIIVLSQQWKVFYRQITDNEIIIVNNAVLVDKYKYNNNGNIISFMGRLCERKGIYDVLKIADKILEEHKEFKIYLCGDGDVERVKNIILKKGLSNRVIVTGWINDDNKDEILKSSIVNILPSYNEGMPMAILETMARGIPNISTNIGGIPNVIKNYDNGILISPGDTKELFNTLNYLLSNKKMRMDISIKAYETIKYKFSIESYNNKFVKLYKSLKNID